MPLLRARAGRSLDQGSGSRGTRNRTSLTHRVLSVGVLTALGLSALAIASGPAAGAARAELPVISVDPKGTADRLPRVPASTWILVDADTGDVLASKDPHRKLPPASTIKVLTAVTLMPHLDLDSTYAATMQDVSQPGTRIGLRAGMSNKVYDLFAGMMMSSGNDAASAVANAVGGWDRALGLMNEEARRLGATNTVALTPNGLDRYDQLTTAADLATIFRAALKTPDLAKIMKTKTMPAQTIDGRKIPLYNRNKMLQLNYPGHLGAKTGTTSMAGKTVVSAFQRNGRTLIVALMRYGGKMERASKLLYDWGFANAKKVNPVEQLPTVGQRPEVTRQPALQMDQEGNPQPGQDGLLAAVSTPEPSDGGSPSAALMVAALLAVGGAGYAATRLRRARQ